MPACFNTAKKLKVDEFYTMMSDIESELQNYKSLLKGKSVYCCCDHPQYSNFYKFLSSHLHDWELKEVICTCKIGDGERGLFTSRNCIQPNEITYDLEGDGSFDSKECIDILLKTDVVITNPPFSKAQAFIKMLIEYGKKFIIVCNRNTIVTNTIFPLLMDGRIKLGFGFKKSTAYFMIPPMLYGRYKRKDMLKGVDNIVRFRNVVWLTNLEVKVPYIKRNYKKPYSESDYAKYDQYDAINVDKITDIPYNYYGVMGVPITFLEGFDTDEFELVGLDRLMPLNTTRKRFTIDGKEKYARVMIKRKNKVALN